MIRALEPVSGMEAMLQRRGLDRVQRRVAGGPGLVSQAMGFTTGQDGVSLIRGKNIWLEKERDQKTGSDQDFSIVASPRVGVDYAGEDAGLSWRFRLKENKFTSPAR